MITCPGLANVTSPLSRKHKGLKVGEVCLCTYLFIFLSILAHVAIDSNLPKATAKIEHGQSLKADRIKGEATTNFAR